MGLIVSVYRDASDEYDCTMGGVSSVFNKLCVVNIDGPFEPNPDCPAMLLVKSRVGDMRFVLLVPAEQNENGEWVEVKKSMSNRMFGGNYAAGSDSRIGEAVVKLIGPNFRFWPAIPIHDRFE